MIKLTPFKPSDFDRFISWIDSKELLITIAGTILTYPLTTDQLHAYLNNPNSISFNVVDTIQNKTIGHAEIIKTGIDTCKLDKVLIGDKAIRGKGIGEKLMNELLDYSFRKLDMNEVELNVYDWNVAGIKCYEKVGFVMSPNKRQTTILDNIQWIALNMTIDRKNWEGKASS
jgi:RimJ/RimL family protein N-acetyltransferase